MSAEIELVALKNALQELCAYMEEMALRPPLPERAGPETRDSAAWEAHLLRQEGMRLAYQHAAFMIELAMQMTERLSAASPWASGQIADQVTDSSLELGTRGLAGPGGIPGYRSVREAARAIGRTTADSLLGEGPQRGR